MGDKTREELLAGAIYCILTGEEGDGKVIPGRNKVREYFKNASESSLRNHTFNGISSIEESLRNDSKKAKELEEILKEDFHIEVLPLAISKAGEQDSFTIAVMREFIPHIINYIINSTGATGEQRRNKDSPLEKSYEENNRQQAHKAPSYSWLIYGYRNGRNQPIESKPLTIKPIETFDELNQFTAIGPSKEEMNEYLGKYKNHISRDIPFCFLKPNINLVNLYLYAAHKQIDLMGIWLEEKAIGIVPLLEVWTPDMPKSKNPSSGILRHSSLYVEAAMMDGDYFRSGMVGYEVDRMSMIMSPYYGLIHFITHHAICKSILNFVDGDGIQIPLIGSRRKGDTPYSSVVRNLIDAASYGISRDRSGHDDHCFRYSGLKNFVNALGKRQKAIYSPFEAYTHMELKDDPVLLSFLKQQGYKFNRIIMNSQAFLSINPLRDLSIRLRKLNRALLYKEWGEMKGMTSYLPIPQFITNFNEIETGSLNK